MAALHFDSGSQIPSLSMVTSLRELRVFDVEEPMVPLGGGPRLQLGYNGEAADVPGRNSIVGAAKARLSRRWGSDHLKRHLAGRKPPTAGNILREGTTPPAWQNKAPSTCCRNSEHAVSEQI